MVYNFKYAKISTYLPNEMFVTNNKKIKSNRTQHKSNEMKVKRKKYKNSRQRHIQMITNYNFIAISQRLTTTK